jgi:hypothetical protein
MSETATTPLPRRRPTGLQAVALLCLGIAIGALCTVMATNALRLKRAHPRGAMALLQFHLQRVQDAVRVDHCDAAAREHLQRVALLAPEIDAAFASRSDDRVFAQRLREMQDAANAAAGEPVRDCRRLEAARARLADACDACHRDYR